MSDDRKLQEAVTRDQALQGAVASSALALMEHRWKVVHEIGIPQLQYAKALGISRMALHFSVKGWEIWQSGMAKTPQDARRLAAVNEAERDSIVEEARLTGMTIAAVCNRRALMAKRGAETVAATALGLLGDLSTKTISDPDGLYDLLCDIADEADALRKWLDEQKRAVA